MDWSWFMTDPVSTFGGEIDTLYYWVLGITGFVFVVTEAVLLWFVFRYRHREGRRAHYTHGSRRLEVLWTIVPFVIVVGISWASTQVWLDAKTADRTEVAEDAFPMRVTAKQFEWNVTYPGPDAELDTDDDFVKRNQLHIPVDRTVRIDLVSEDVIHSLFLPDFRVKQDAVPGMVIPVWFQAIETGEYPLACAELCGLGHYRMRATVTVHEEREFERWLASETGTAAEPEDEPAPADTARVEMEGEAADATTPDAPASDGEAEGGERA